MIACVRSKRSVPRRDELCSACYSLCCHHSPTRAQVSLDSSQQEEVDSNDPHAATERIFILLAANRRCGAALSAAHAEGPKEEMASPTSL